MSFTDNDQIWSIPLNRYERDNLLFLLNAIGYGAKPIKPFGVFNTGDWVGQVALKLRRQDGSYSIDENDRPNASREQIELSVQGYREVPPLTEEERRVIDWASDVIRIYRKIHRWEPNTVSSFLHGLKHLDNALEAAGRRQ